MLDHLTHQTVRLVDQLTVTLAVQLAVPDQSLSLVVVLRFEPVDQGCFDSVPAVQYLDESHQKLMLLQPVLQAGSVVAIQPSQYPACFVERQLVQTDS